MRPPCVEWRADMEPLGDAVVAIGVFDGVHVGHQALLHDVVQDARRQDALAVAVTFDRDPDQVVMPDSAAAQLLTLHDKCLYIEECGIDIVLVVPFTPAVAKTPAQAFLEEILHLSARVRAIHVGADFRFGAGAAGDVGTLRGWAEAHGAQVVAHELTAVSGGPVTSTRIRSLVAAGDVAGAATLLGRPTRVSGVVHEGRNQGAQLGFPTANVGPAAFAALPADGVYAGRAILADGTSWPAAIAVGTPPSFPEARDYLEAHLIGFDGDLYGEQLVLEFVGRLRENRAFDSLVALSDQIAADVAAATELVPAPEPEEARTWELSPLAAAASGIAHALFGGEDPLTDAEIVDDPEALEAAERAVANLEPQDAYADFDETWVEVLGPVTLVNVTARLRSFEITSPLSAESIPFAWDPISPEEISTVRPELASAQRFHLYVPSEHAVRARELVAWWEEGSAPQ